MVARQFQVRHKDSSFEVNYDTDDGFEVLQFQLFSLTAIPPGDQKIFSDVDDRLVSDDGDLVAISGKLRLVAVKDDEKQQDGESTSRDVQNDVELLKSDEELAKMLQAEEEALMFQQFVASEDGENFESRIRPYIDQVRLYEDPIRQEAARITVPVEELEEKALVSLAKEGSFKPLKSEVDHAFLLQLLYWFKQSFRWVNAPPCDDCGNITESQGMGAALPSELQFGGSRVELYRCKFCSRTTRFPRYNDPSKLVETRRGRCGEWAKCFMLYCRAFGYDSRLILDFTDHVWTECFSPFLGRWMHLDPCEAAYDKPVLYEKGWNKKLNYIFAIAKDGVYDVTKRYTRNWPEVLSRRNVITEHALSVILTNITRECRSVFTPDLLSILEDRDRKESQELERDCHSTDEPSISLPGRQSGDKEWRKSRFEIGPDENSSFSNIACPPRKCIDEHVTRIYNAFHPVLSRFLEEELSKSRIIQVLQFVKGILMNMRKSSFRSRRVSISSESDMIKPFLPSFKELLNALSLDSKLDSDGRVNIWLAGQPIETSLALHVVLDALDETVENINKSDNFSKASLTLPILKLNRIHSGSVLASGEEVLLGIATSTFDGTRLSKWEEPNGARGCWIIYKVSENQMQELVAYELMSANDAPERDPMDWIVEGSDDEGSSWYVLDEQSGQRFEDRFERRVYKITSVIRQSNAFRFRFLAVRNAESNSRLQIGSIDLYASS